MRRLWATAVLAGALLLVPAAGALATEVYVTPAEEDVDGESSATVSDGGGRANLLVTFTSNRRYGRLTVRERGRRPLKAEDGCRQRAPREVTCRTAPYETVSVYGGGGPDVIHGRGLIWALAGEAGNDRLIADGPREIDGGAGNDRLVGSRRAELLAGGRGRDTIEAGPGDDTLSGDGDGFILTGNEYWVTNEFSRRRYDRRHQPDVLDGGPGRDTAGWLEHLRGVRVDLAAGSGPRGDRLRAIEDVVGSASRDVLLGDAGPNRLFGASGNDRLIGRGGADRLDGGRSPGSGPPSEDESPDRFDCGRGGDLVVVPEESVLPPDCERMAPSREYDGSVPVQWPAFPRAAGSDTISVSVHCESAPGSCRRRVEVSSRGVVLGRSRTVALKQRTTWVTVRLSRRLPEAAPVRFDVIEPSPGGREWRWHRWRIRCHGPPACR
jgi:hypothetical protein